MSQHTEKIFAPLQMSRSMAMLSWSCVGSSCFANLDVRKHNQYHSDWVTVASRTALSYDSSDKSMYSWPTKGSWGAGGEILGWNIKVLISCSKLWLLLWQHTPFWHTCHAHHPGNKIKYRMIGDGLMGTQRQKELSNNGKLTLIPANHISRRGIKRRNIFCCITCLFFICKRLFVQWKISIRSIAFPMTNERQ